MMAKRAEKITERLDGNLLRANRLTEGDQDGVRRASSASVEQAQLVLPGVEQLECARGIRHLIAEVVRPAAIGIHVVKMLVQAAREQPRDDIEILVVMRGEDQRV